MNVYKDLQVLVWLSIYNIISSMSIYNTKSINSIKGQESNYQTFRCKSVAWLPSAGQFLVSVWKMQDLLLLLVLFFLYHRLQPEGEPAGLADSTEEDEEQVMITNRYFQWVLRSQGSHGLTIAERIGGRLRTKYFQIPFLQYLGLTSERGKVDFHRGRKDPERWQRNVSQWTNSWDSGDLDRLHQSGFLEVGGGIPRPPAQSEGPHGL